MIRVKKERHSVIPIDYKAVQKYENHFNYLLNHYTFEVKLLNNQIYYTFADIPFMQWQQSLAVTEGFIQATEFLDKISVEHINTSTIKSVRDVGSIVRSQYETQRDIIFSSYGLVLQIMQHSEKKVVRDAIRLVEKSRANVESKRRYWRVLNQDYYGLDIHPLMEYELEELQRIAYACEHYDDNPEYSMLPFVLGSSTLIAGGTAVAYVVLRFV